MTPHRWQHIEQLYHSALEQDPDCRGAFLIESCAGDADLRRELESLLDSEDSAEEFFAVPGLKAALAAADACRDEWKMPSPPRPGEQLGHYRVIALLGAGGMGEVYRATDTRLQRDVAIKLLPWELSADHLTLGRFQREARAASALNHPHICTVHDMGEHEGRPFLVMELVEGKSLKEHICGASVPAAELLDVAVQIAEGLQAAHAKGIVHRDIKPANIVLAAGLHVKILDFGLAKRVAASDALPAAMAAVPSGDAEAGLTGTMQQGSVMGTIAYASPEQASGEEVDVRTDIYSFGVVLYEMATGRPPFRGTPEQVIAATLNDTPAPPSEWNPAIAPGLERIILKALAKEPAARHQSACDILSELRKLQQSKLRRAGSKTSFAAAVGVLALAAAVAGVTAARQPRATVGVPAFVQRQLTANPPHNAVYTAALSADGGQLAYADLEGVHVRAIETGEVRDIALPPKFCFR